jgi:Carboxypeptidase regulatory-like domain
MRRNLLPFVIFSAMLSLAAAARGQSTFGSITGTVKDPTGAVIPQADVRVTNQGTGAVREVTTGATGVFNVPDLDVGVYELHASAKGFTTFERGGLHLSANQIVNVPVQLVVGAASSVVQVRAASPVITTEGSEIAGSLGNEAVQNLPLLSRQQGDEGLFDYLTLNTGVEANNGNSLPVVGGARLETGTVQLVDGVTVMAYDLGSGPVQPGFAAVEEVSAVTSVAPAEFATAGTLQMVTRGGTNDFHGSAYWDYNGNALNARDFYSPTVPFRVYNDFGASLGGPIKKDKLFFFADYEGSREAAVDTLVESVPLPAWRNGDFRSLLSQGIVLNDPSTGQPFPNNQIPTSLLSGVSQKVQSYAYPLPNTGPVGSTANNWVANEPGLTGFTDWNSIDGRVDYDVSSRDTIFGRYSWRTLPLTAAGVPYPLDRDQLRRARSGVLSWDHTFTPSVLNEFRFGATFHDNHFTASAVGTELLQQFGIEGLTTAPSGKASAPNFNITGVTPWDPDDNADDYNDNAESDFEWLDNLTWTRGRHFMKFGVDAIRDRLGGNFFDAENYGEYDFPGTYTGFGYADFLLGLPETTELSVPTPERDLRGTTWGLFAQDQFRVTSSLTLNYGIRWELQGPYHSNTGIIYNFDPSNGALVVPNNGVSLINPDFPKNIPIVTASEASYPANSLLNFNKSNIEPRIGFAYNLFGHSKTVIRSGYGIYTNLVYQPLADDQMSGGPFSGSVQYINSITNGVPLFSFPSPFLPTGTTSTQSVDGVNPNLKTPYTQEWNLSVEHQIGSWGLRISYLGSRSDQLLYLRNLNEPAPSTTAFSTSERPYPLYSSITYADSGGNELYNALEVSAQKKFGQNLTLNTGWTWQKGLTDTQDAGAEGTVFGGQVIQNQFDRAVEETNDGNIVPQRVYADALYTLPFGQGQRFLSNSHGLVQQVLGGWRTTWIMVAQSGLWFSPSFSGFDPSNTGTFGGLPDRVSGVPLYPANQTINNWFNANAFKIPGCPNSNTACPNPTDVGVFGNAAYNTLSGPALVDLDFGLAKDFRIGERVRLTFSTTMDNVLNHPNFSTPVSDISDTTTVGTISSTATANFDEPTAREITLGLRLQF